MEQYLVSNLLCFCSNFGTKNTIEKGLVMFCKILWY